LAISPYVQRLFPKVKLGTNIDAFGLEGSLRKLTIYGGDKARDFVELHGSRTDVSASLPITASCEQISSKPIRYIFAITVEGSPRFVERIATEKCASAKS